MQLTKMSRCQKAAFGFKGTFTGPTLFKDVDALRAIIGDEPKEITNCSKYPGVPMPSWFLEIEAQRGWNTSGPGAVNFKLYVNCDLLVQALTQTSEEKKVANA